MAKVLIVDDHPGRYRLLTDRLTACGLGRDDIKFLSSTNEAHEELSKRQYDLLVLDILIPAWPDLDPDRVNSADLLFSIQSDGGILKPRYVVGITADLNGSDAVLDEFKKNTWTVIEYSHVDDSWVEQIVNCVSYLKGSGNERRQVGYVFDLAVICALKEPELEQVIRLPWNWEASKPLDDVTFFREGVLNVGSRKYRVAAVHAPRMGMVSAAVLASKVIESLRPRVLAMTGICAAHKSKAQIGDVIVADPAWDFQSGKLKIADTRTVMEFSPHQIPMSAYLRGRFEDLASDPQLSIDIGSEFGSDAPRGFKLRIGPVASGAAVLADGQVIEQIRQFQNRDLLGLEMEIYGLYAAAEQASSPQPRCLALKGVCDFANSDKHDGAQKFAAFASAQVLKRYIERYAADLFSG
jgi:nucleoside phosphorylase/CheY-like chemotaxis protein